jgi:hypothetical protein
MINSGKTEGRLVDWGQTADPTEVEVAASDHQLPCDLVVGGDHSRVVAKWRLIRTRRCRPHGAQDQQTLRRLGRSYLADAPSRRTGPSSYPLENRLVSGPRSRTLLQRPTLWSGH